MCLFTHFAAGALAGGMTGNVWYGAAAGLASHAVLDAIPHYDHPDWRLELAAGVFSLILLLLMPFATWAAVVGGIFGMVPDIENLFQKLGKMRREQFIFPSHTGLIPHGRALGPRSLVWQLAIFIFCFGSLGLLAPASVKAAQVTDAQPLMGEPVVRLLSSDQYLTRIQINCPVERQPTDWFTLNLEDVLWGVPETSVQDEEGNITFHPPELVLNIAVPTRGAVTTSVVGITWWKEPETSVSPADLASFGLPAVFKGVPITGSNLSVGLGGGVLRQAVIEIKHPPSGNFSRQLDAAGQADPPDKNTRDLDKAPSALLNPELFTALSRGGRALLVAQKAAIPRGSYNHFDLTSNWVRLSIDKIGLFQLTGQELSAMGVGTEGVDPAKIRLYRGGSFHLDPNPEISEATQADRVGLKEVAIQVLDGHDGEWNLDDEIRFYAFSADFWTDRANPSARKLDFYNHLYQNEGVYWLTWENISTASPMGTAPLRVAEITTPANGGTDLSMAKLRMHKEEQIRSGFGLSNDNWVWDNSIYYTKTMDFEIFAPVPDSSATFVVEYRGIPHGSPNYEFTVRGWVNDDTDHAQDGSVFATSQPDSFRIRLVGSSRAMVEGRNILSFQSTNEERDYAILLDSFDIFYWAELDLTRANGQLKFTNWWENVPFDGQLVNLKITVPTSENVILWEVSDVVNSSVLTGDLVESQLISGLTLNMTQDRHFVATTEDDLYRVAAGRIVVPVDLRDLPTDAHYIVIYPEIFSGAAHNLANFRSSFLPGDPSPKARAVLVDDIYNTFSGGQKDLRAIRNYLKWLYEAGGGSLRYVCLLGNGTLDPRNYKNLDPNVDLMDLIPVDHRGFFPKNLYSNFWYHTYGTDDSIVSFEAPPSSIDADFPDVAIGRLPAVSVTEANNMVEKMIQYSSNAEPGIWSNRFLMVADDCVTPSLPVPNRIEERHMKNAELLSNSYLPASLDLTKVYGASYDFPPGSGVKPQARQDITTALNEGVTIFHYVGHGAENNLADEQMFQSQDIANLTNEHKGCAFIAFSCDVGVFDSPIRRSMAEMFLVPENSGGVASICASQTSVTTQNDALAFRFYSALFPDQHVAGDQTISEALLEAKGLMGSLSYRHNSQRYNLLSDPALSLPHPVDDLTFSASSLDTLKAGARQVVVLDDASGLMLGAGDAYSLRIEESGYGREYIASYSGEEPVIHTYHQHGATVFDGHGTMNSSELRVPFKVPVQLRYGDQARVRLIVNGLNGPHLANETVSSIRQAIGPNNDVVGPQIELAFEDNRFRVKAGTQLTATLQDTSSIAILGTTPGNSLLLEFDESGFMTDVTSSFLFEADSYTNGRISFPLPGDLPLGNHQAALHASDVLGNVGNDTISFEIVPESIVGMDSITLFPNPTPGPCRLIFELSDAMLVKWEIYTLSGHRIKSLEENLSAGPQIMPWDGRDDQGDEIANGTYLYVLRGTVAAGGERDITETGKLVIMR